MGRGVLAMNNLVTRRKALKRLLRVSGGLLFSGFSMGGLSSLWAKPEKRAFLVEALGQKDGYSVGELTTRVFEAAGGITRFVSPGDVVVVKPNISWARRPDLAATTNPLLLEAVIRLCQEAGARRVRIADNTINDPRRCFALSGAGAVAKKTGAELIYPRSLLMREMKLGGSRLDVWPVFVPLVEADKLINLPVAKHHGLTTLTLGMKNWMGAIGGRRSALHQDIQQSIVDLARFFNPTFTLIDATRIMITNGPSGGRLSDIVTKNTLILSDDQVAADAKASMLFGLNPQQIGHILLGQRWGLGTYDSQQLDQKKVIL
jgi:uncharacterized protein (DUF362 family)